MARLGRLERGRRSLGVAQLADQNRVRVLSECTPECLAERAGVDADLSLVDDAALVGMDDLDRVLDRDDVLGAGLVDVADDRRERGRLAGAGRARDEHKPVLHVGEATNSRRHVQVLEAGDAARDEAHGDRDRAALPEGVHTKARLLIRLVRGVELSGLPERGEAMRGSRARRPAAVQSSHRSKASECRASRPIAPSTRIIGG